jgi:hypothetical protein
MKAQRASIPWDRKQRGLVSLAIAIIAFFAVVAISMAQWVFIETNDGVIDSNWANVTPVFVDSTNDSSINDKDEIKHAWYVYDGDFISFRIDVWDSTDFLSGNNMRAVAALDCNKNGNFYDGDSGGVYGDRAIVLYPWERVDIYDGAGNILIYSSSGNELSDINGNSGEWKAPLERIYPECRGLKESIPLAFSIILNTAPQSPVSQAPLSGDPPYSYHNPIDFGDAPNDVQWVNNNFQCDRYDTKLPCDGPRHGVTSLQMGLNIDPDAGELADDGAGDVLP